MPTGITVPLEKWYVASIDMSAILSQYQVYTMTNSTGLFHMSVVNLTEWSHDKQHTGLNFGYFSSYSNVKIVGPTLECNGNMIHLETKSPQLSYIWRSQSTGDEILSTQPYIDINRTDRFYLTSLTPNGCSATDSIDVEFILPEINFPESINLCPGELYTLQAPTTHADYQWSTGATGTSLDLSGIADSQSQIWLEVTDDLGCTNRDTVDIIGYPGAEVNLTIGSEPLIPGTAINVCMGDTIFNTTPMAHYRWELDGQVIQSDANYLIPQQGGIYKLTAWSPDSCNTTIDINITVSPLPEFDIPDIIGCPNTSQVIQGPANAVSFLWQDGSTTSSYNATQPDTYWLKITDDKGCSAMDTIIYSWHPQSIIDITYDTGIFGTANPDSIYFCPENPIILNAQDTYNNYLWSTGETNTSTISVLVPSNQTQIVWVQANDQNNCIITDTVTLITYESPMIDLSNAPSSICLGDTIFNTTNNAKTQWEIVGQPIDPTQTNNYFIPTNTGTYDIRLTVWNTENCGTIQTKTITVNPLPDINLSNSTICANTPTNIIAPAGMANYLWHDGTTNQQYTATEEGEAWVSITDINGCINSDTATISWFPQPVVDLSIYSPIVGADIQP
ncbi:hypothetical protein LX69_01851, partial [Breznakibacter xylanolyticus]